MTNATRAIAGSSPDAWLDLRAEIARIDQERQKPPHESPYTTRSLLLIAFGSMVAGAAVSAAGMAFMKFVLLS